MEQIINYRDIPTDKKAGILNALEQIGFIPAYGGVKTMQRIMEKSIPGSGPQFYFVFREDKLIGYNFLIGNTKRYKAFPWLAISNADEQKMVVCEEMMGMQGDFLLIEISNSYSGRGSLRSGTGLANIKAVAEKYHGAMEVRTDGEKFTLSVLLIIPQQSESISQQVC